MGKHFEAPPRMIPPPLTGEAAVVVAQGLERLKVIPEGSATKVQTINPYYLTDAHDPAKGVYGTRVIYKDRSMHTIRRDITTFTDVNFNDHTQPTPPGAYDKMKALRPGPPPPRWNNDPRM